MLRLDTQEIYVSICQDLGLQQFPDITIKGRDPVSPSRYRIGDATAAALASLGAELISLWRLRSGQSESCEVSIEGCIAQLMGVFFNETNGVSCSRLMDDKKLLALNDFFRDANRRYVFLLSTYPHLRDINCAVLGVPFDRQSLADAVAHWDAFELEEKIASLGGTCVAVRSPAEWSATPAGAALVDSPLVSIEKLDDSPPQPFTTKPAEYLEGLPLKGIRVLDNTHVIAGPIASRMAAEYGAEVLSIASPDHKDPLGMIVETGIGKRSAWCDLHDEDSKAAFWDVLSGADVYVSSYLSLDKLGLDHQSLCRHRSGLIILDFHAFGADGPWGDRGGFDQLACSVTGFSLVEGGEGRPSLPPTHLLNDYLAAVLGTAALVECLRRRAEQGGCWRIRINLSRICVWVQSLGIFPEAEVSDIEKPSITGMANNIALQEVEGRFGKTKVLPTQIKFSGSIRPCFTTGAEPTGASKLAWKEIEHLGINVC